MDEDDSKTEPKTVRITNGGEIVQVKRGQKYRIRLKLPPEMTGKKRWTWSPQRTVLGSKAKAQTELDSYRRELEDAFNNRSTKKVDTVGSYARDFQKRRIDEKNGLSPLTIKRDAVEIGRIDQYIGNVSLQQLSGKQVEQMYKNAKRDKLSDDAIFKLDQKLRQILDQAVDEGIIPASPCTHQMKRKHPRKTPREPIDQESVKRLAEDIRESTKTGRTVAVWLALATGMRRGEILGLRWRNVDLDNGIIHVVEQLDDDMERRPPKSEMSRRALYVDEETLGILKEWRQAQSDRFFMGKDVSGDCPVCSCDTKPTPIKPETFDRWRRRFFVKEGLGRFEEDSTYTAKDTYTRHSGSHYVGADLHALRHTHATLLIGSGADVKTVQHRMGHATVGTTLNIYAHVLNENDKKAAESIGGFLMG